MKRILLPLTLFTAVVFTMPCAAAQLRVVTTLPDYAFLAREIGGDRVSVSAIVRGDQDAHFIRPKPSFVNMIRRPPSSTSPGTRGSAAASPAMSPSPRA